MIQLPTDPLCAERRAVLRRDALARIEEFGPRETLTDFDLEILRSAETAIAVLDAYEASLSEKTVACPNCERWTARIKTLDERRRIAVAVLNGTPLPDLETPA